MADPEATPMLFEVKISAVGEVRDAEGNLISSEPVEITTTMTEQQLQEFMGEGS